MGEWVFLCSPELVKEMFSASAEVLTAGEVNRAQLGFMLGTDATFCLDGEPHRARRRLVQHHLNGRGALKHTETIREIAAMTLAGWPTDQPFALLPHMRRFALEVLVRVIFGTGRSARSEELLEVFDRYANEGLRSPLMMLPLLQINLGRYSPWGRVLHLRRTVVETYRRAIEARIAGEETAVDASLLNALLAVEDASGSRQLSTQAILDEVINILFASHETTGSILTWAVESILTHPEVLARIREELDEVLGGQPVTVDDVGHLTYLDAVINEAIRYRPIAPMAGIRRVKKAFEIGGYTVPAGVIVAQCFPVMSRRPDIFSHPDTFDPNNFYGQRHPPFTWNPYGGGTRMCLGKGLAQVEMKVLLATLLQQIDLCLAQDEVKPVRHGIFFAPSQGLRVTLQQRLPQAA